MRKTPSDTPSPAAGGMQAVGDTSVELARLARQGDVEALDALFAREEPRLRRWARRRLPRWARGIADTVDIVQDVMLNTFRRIEAVEVKRQGALQAYLRQAIDNRIRDEMRLAARRPAPQMLDSAMPAGGLSPLDAAVDAETARRYREALLQMRASDRELVVGRVELGYSYEQLAVASGRPTAESARLAVRRAVLRVAQLMKDQG